MLSRWKKLQEKIIFQGKYNTVLSKDYELPGGNRHTFEVLTSTSSCVILAFDQSGQVIVEKQFRAGPERILFEPAAGAIENGETPEQAAQRELLEETGYAGDLELVANIHRWAYSSDIEYIFVAKNCRKIAETVFDDGEYVETILMSLTEFRQLIKSENFLNAESAYLALDHLNLL